MIRNRILWIIEIFNIIKEFEKNKRMIKVDCDFIKKRNKLDKVICFIEEGIYGELMGNIKGKMIFNRFKGDKVINGVLISHEIYHLVNGGHKIKSEFRLMELICRVIIMELILLLKEKEILYYESK